MDLRNKNILIAAQFAPPYGGNFIPSIRALCTKLRESRGAAAVSFALPRAAETKEWAAELGREYKIFFTGDDRQLISPAEAERIIRETEPAIVYTHFEGYDTAFLPYLGKDAATVWHMHDTLYYQRNPLKKLYQRYSFWRHYGLPALTRKVGAIAVCEHELRFIRPLLLGRTLPQMCLPNAIDPDRVRPVKGERHEPFSFLAFGGRNVQKRVDLVFAAGEILASKGAAFRVVITSGTDTENLAREYFKGSMPDWLCLSAPTRDINALFAQADCFISSSVHETFSYAVAEASIAGLPVVQSEIEGTEWNASNPSTFLFESASAADLARAMEAVMDEEHEALARKCRLTAETNRKALSLEAWTDSVINFFEHL